MADNLAGKVKDFILFAPRGALSLVRDTAPTVINVLVSRGKIDDAKKTAESALTTDEPEVEEPLAKRRLGTYTEDITRTKGLMYSALGAFEIVKKNLPTIQAVTDSKGKEVADENVASAREKVSEKIPRRLKKQEPVVEPVETHDDNFVESVVKGGVLVTQSVVGAAVGATNSCFSVVSKFFQATPHEITDEGETTQK